MPPSRKSCPSAPLLGAHTSIAGGFHLAVDRALSAGFTVMQIFVKSNRQWFAPPLREQERDAFLQHPRRSELKSIFAHNGYLINPAAPEGTTRDNSIRALREELDRADQLGLPFLVLHPGAHLGDGIEVGIARCAAALDEVCETLPKAKTRLAVECTAGQGTCLGHDLAHLRDIFGAMRHPERACVCLDTAHLFAAGYDFRNEAGYTDLIKTLKATVGLKSVVALHMNDSKVPLGSRVDRHDHIGQGHIGLTGFAHWMRDPVWLAVPKVLETPKSDDMHEDVENLDRLRSLIETASPTKGS
jgi:deoxyribonuclease-4